MAHQKWATVSDLLRSLTKTEQMRESLIFWANHSFAHFFTKHSENRWGKSQLWDNSRINMVIYRINCGYLRDDLCTVHVYLKDDQWSVDNSRVNCGYLLYMMTCGYLQDDLWKLQDKLWISTGWPEDKLWISTGVIVDRWEMNSRYLLDSFARRIVNGSWIAIVDYGWRTASRITDGNRGHWWWTLCEWP